MSKTIKNPTPITPQVENSFDIAAHNAELELLKMNPAQIKTVATWWSKFYMTAGHKRLGRILVREAKKNKWAGAKEE